MMLLAMRYTSLLLGAPRHIVLASKFHCTTLVVKCPGSRSVDQLVSASATKPLTHWAATPGAMCLIW